MATGYDFRLETWQYFAFRDSRELLHKVIKNDDFIKRMDEICGYKKRPWWQFWGSDYKY